MEYLVPAYGGVAQLGEHLLCKQGVRSSILLISTKGRRKTNSLMLANIVVLRSSKAILRA